MDTEADGTGRGRKHVYLKQCRGPRPVTKGLRTLGTCRVSLIRRMTALIEVARED